MTMRSIVPFGWGGAMLPSRAASNDPFVQLWNDIDRLFGNVVRGAGPSQPGPTGQVGLPIEVADTGTGLEVVAELPGVEEKGVSVELMGNTLAIKGEKKATEEHQDSGCHLAERRYGTFARTLQLPFEVEAAA
jgi:HSP20 family protein